ncbi:MAG: hypothetical protein H7A17_02425 [Sinobacteraceae bacterium]|nr:hypothetical protein [Nevskiaceae bacterium]
MVSSAAATLARRHQTDLLLQPPLEDVDLLNWHAFDRALVAGHRHTREKLAGLPAELARRLGLRIAAGGQADRIGAAYRGCRVARDRVVDGLSGRGRSRFAATFGRAAVSTAAPARAA